MALPAAFLDELRARTSMQALVSRRVRLSKSGRNWKGCCPFHNEKSPSFYVYEDGFHCFGCGAHGDAISFVMQTGGGSFIEAVESLAGEAGLEVPKPSARAMEAEQERLDLFGVMDAAQAEFVRLLHSREGAGGLAYLRSRGLTDETIARFGLGWSGEGRGSLVRVLAPAGIVPGMLEEAGLLRPADESGAARELYWNRVTFPIRDRRGRIVSFGGRTLGDAKPKYINGPETRLFQKKHTLYAVDVAREGVRKGAKLVVAEGYMDVIAMHQAGFTGAVAPLGTALTAEQLEALWQISPAPVLCFDGDPAGARAAARAAELCLPLIGPDRMILFAVLPQGHDPDSLIQLDNGTQLGAILETPKQHAKVVYDSQREGLPAGPEGRALFRLKLEAAANRVEDQAFAKEFKNEFRQMFYDERASKKTKLKRFAYVVRIKRSLALLAATARDDRLKLLTGLILFHPDVIHDIEEAYLLLDLPLGYALLRDEILAYADAGQLDSSALFAHLRTSGLEKELKSVLSGDLPLLRLPSAMPSEVEYAWWYFFGLVRGIPLLDGQVREARLLFAKQPTVENEERLVGLVKARQEIEELGQQ